MPENTAVLTRGAAPADFTVSYGQHALQRAEVRLPQGVRDAVPLVLLWHGGFWRTGHDMSEVAPLAAALAANGFAVASLEYRAVGDGGGWPGTLEDAALAADTVPGLVEAERPGLVDQRRIVYAGHSAGGHLAVWCAMRGRLPAGAPGSTGRGPQPIGVVALAPVLDLVRAYALGAGGGAVAAFLGGAVDEFPERYAVADPAPMGPPAVPVVIVHGEQDTLVPVLLSRDYAAMNGAEVVTEPGADHFAVIDPESTAWPHVLGAFRRLSIVHQA